MKLKHLFAWFVAFFALTTVFTSCSSDDDDDTLTTVVPDEMIGTWKFSELTLALGKNGKGSITTYTYSDDDEGGNIAKLSRGTTSEYKLFNYTYQSSTRTLTATCVADQTTFTIRDMYVRNGKLNITITLNGTEKVLSDGTKVEDDGSNLIIF